MLNSQDNLQHGIRSFLSETSSFISNPRIERALNSYQAPHFSVGENPTRELKNHKREADELLRAIHSDKSQIDRDLNDARNHHRSIYLERCRELLGADLAEELNQR